MAAEIMQNNNTSRVDQDHPAFLKAKRQFENRLNKLLCHYALADKLDSHELDFTVMQALEEVIGKSGKVHADEDLLQEPVFRAMLDLNILWKSKYYGQI